MGRKKVFDKANADRNLRERERVQQYNDKLQTLMGYLPKAPYVKHLQQEEVIDLAIAELAKIRPVPEEDNNYRLSRPVQVGGKTMKVWLKSSQNRKTYKPATYVNLESPKQPKEPVPKSTTTPVGLPSHHPAKEQNLLPTISPTTTNQPAPEQSGFLPQHGWNNQHYGHFGQQQEFSGYVGNPGLPFYPCML